MLKRTFLLAVVFFLGMIVFPELQSDFRSELLTTKSEITKFNFPDFCTFCVKEDFHQDQILEQKILILRHNTNNTKPKPLSDQAYFKEKRGGILDRCPESAIFTFSIIFLRSFLSATSLARHLAFVKYSSWTGNSAKIRPPPVL